MALGLWQNFFVKIESAVFVYCHGNHPVFCVNSVFKRCTGHNTDPIVLISLQSVRSSCGTMAKLFQEIRISGFVLLP